MSKHTRTPWRHRTGSGGESVYSGPHRLGGKSISVDICLVYHRGHETMPNARLITAAPLGYELAAEILRVCDASTGRQISEITRREIEPLRKMAEEFIANVKGKSS